jgi:diadenosine tetraphosphatase ApaH/serine/threonine PP2A family protein phosphatase
MFSRFFRRSNKDSAGHVARLPEGLRIYALGDIHGCAALLDQMHELIFEDLEGGERPDEVRIVYLGDYVDRGPDSFGVLERLSQPMAPAISRTFLKGNHEEMLENFLEDPEVGTVWRQLGGLETLLSYRIDVNAVLSRAGFRGLSEELTAHLPSHHADLLSELETHCAYGDYFFCHAGVRPRVPLNQQSPRDLLWIRQEFLESTHDFGKIVVHGHSPVDTPDVRSNRINIDTGAYATGRLTCLVLEGDARRFLST